MSSPLPWGGRLWINNQMARRSIHCPRCSSGLTAALSSYAYPASKFLPDKSWNISSASRSKILSKKGEPPWIDMVLSPCIPLFQQGSPFRNFLCRSSKSHDISRIVVLLIENWRLTHGSFALQRFLLLSSIILRKGSSLRRFPFVIYFAVFTYCRLSHR